MSERGDGPRRRLQVQPVGYVREIGGAGVGVEDGRHDTFVHLDDRRRLAISDEGVALRAGGECDGSIQVVPL